MKSIRTLLTGDIEYREFHDAINWLNNHTQVIPQKNIDAAADQLHRIDRSPDAIVVAQSRPGQFTSSQVERLHAAAPLARIVALLGSWCEGEMRTGRPWPGVIRVYWHQWSQRSARELTTGTSGSWTMPRTTSDSETFLRLSNQRVSNQPGLIAIYSQVSSAFDYLADACRSTGLSCAQLTLENLEAANNAQAVIWNCAVTGRESLKQLRVLSEAIRPVPVLALLDFPRADDQALAISAGAAAVISKPFLVNDLVQQLDSFALTGQSRISPAA